MYRDLYNTWFHRCQLVHLIIGIYALHTIRCNVNNARTFPVTMRIHSYVYKLKFSYHLKWTQIYIYICVCAFLSIIISYARFLINVYIYKHYTYSLCHRIICIISRDRLFSLVRLRVYMIRKP